MTPRFLPPTAPRELTMRVDLAAYHRERAFVQAWWNLHREVVGEHSWCQGAGGCALQRRAEALGIR